MMKCQMFLIHQIDEVYAVEIIWFHSISLCNNIARFKCYLIIKDLQMENKTNWLERLEVIKEIVIWPQILKNLHLPAYLDLLKNVLDFQRKLNNHLKGVKPNVLISLNLRSIIKHKYKLKSVFDIKPLSVTFLGAPQHFFWVITSRTKNTNHRRT